MAGRGRGTSEGSERKVFASIPRRSGCRWRTAIASASEAFLGAEYDDLPEPVRKEVQTFADVNVAWLRDRLIDAKLVENEDAEERARAIFAAIAGAQLLARSRSDIAIFDSMIKSYRGAGLLP
jgi:hypothetical protein